MILLTGGARSGKSSAATALVAGVADVVFLATATASDDEMAERIEFHRRDRPDTWAVIEEPVEIEAAIRSVPDDGALILDCLTLWLANVLQDSTDEEILDASSGAALAAADRGGDTVVITNEVGSGIVPMDPVGRRFRDLAGRVNQMWSSQSDRSFLVVAGRLLELESAGSLDI